MMVTGTAASGPPMPYHPPSAFASDAEVRIAKPLLAIATPAGVLWGVVEAYRLHWYLAVLMVLLLGAVGAFLAFTWRRLRGEQAAASVSTHDNVEEQRH
jgi:hypothetical protein